MCALLARYFAVSGDTSKSTLHSTESERHALADGVADGHLASTAPQLTEGHAESLRNSETVVLPGFCAPISRLEAPGADLREVNLNPKRSSCRVNSSDSQILAECRKGVTASTGASDCKDSLDQPRSSANPYKPHGGGPALAKKVHKTCGARRWL